jgi:hypothetical protein
VREQSRFAAAVVFVLYAVDTVAVRPIAVGLGVAVVLFSNLRATRIASRWNLNSNEAIDPPRLEETWSDKFTDRIPKWLWPKVRVSFYIFSIGFLMLEPVGVAIFLRHRVQRGRIRRRCQCGLQSQNVDF